MSLILTVLLVAGAVVGIVQLVIRWLTRPASAEQLAVIVLGVAVWLLHLLTGVGAAHQGAG